MCYDEDGENIMAKKMNHYYLCFSQEVDIADTPFGALSKIGRWSRRSNRIYEGTTELKEEEIKAWLYSECRISPSRFKIMNEEDSIYLER